MYIIKLNAIGSTNTYLKEMTAISLPKDYTVVVTDKQTDGRGQMGTNWHGENGKNLTVSVFKHLKTLEIIDQFYISMATALSISHALKAFRIPQIHIKWPNDILSADKKICGILIENIIKNNQLQGSVIGFGLNVNQRYFDDLPQASSMNLLTGILFNKDEVLSEVLKQFQYYFKLLEEGNLAEIKSKYEAMLFRKNKPSTFKTNQNEIFTGIIKGVNDNGRLKVLTEDEIVKTFELKEITLLY